MARIVHIEIGLTESVNVEPYVYIKPSVNLRAELQEGDNYDEVFEGLRKELKERMGLMVDQIKADYEMA